MRITGLGQTANVNGTGRKKAARGAGDSFSSALESEQTAAATPLVAAMPVAGLGLLALQEAPTATDGRSKGVARAEALLDQLTELRRSILLGVISAGQLQGLLAQVRDNRAVTDDPRLAGLLAEIELRAAVELAKLGIFPSQ